MPNSQDDRERLVAIAVQRAVGDVVSRLLTEPLSQARLAKWFHVHPDTMRSRILPRIPGTQKIGGLWRLPLVAIPPGYLVARGVIRELSDEICRSLRNLDAPDDNTSFDSVEAA